MKSLVYGSIVLLNSESTSLPWTTTKKVGVDQYFCLLDNGLTYNLLLIELMVTTLECMTYKEGC